MNDKQANMAILAGTIEGDVKIKNATGPGSVGHDNTEGDIFINGDVKYEGNDSELFAIGAVIGGDLKVSNNTNDGDGPQIEDNMIDGDLKCKGNDPAPFYLFPNVVGGELVGQCAGFDGP